MLEVTLHYNNYGRIMKAIGTEIEWFNVGRDPTQEVMKRREKDKKTGEMRVISNTVE